MDHDEYPPMEPTAWSSEEDPEPVEVDQRALIDKILARYSTDFPVLRETLQNADDAKAKHVLIRFETESFCEGFLAGRNQAPDLSKNICRWTIQNNGTPFSSQDWDRLKTIADGNPDENKVGAFGVGFYSVFSVTDKPCVQSAGKRMRFHWGGKDKKQLFVSRATQMTSPTPISNPWTTFELNAHTPAPIPGTPTEISRFLAASLPFMANLERVTVSLDSYPLLRLAKSSEVPRSIPLLEHLRPKANPGFMTVSGVDQEEVFVDAKTFLYGPSTTPIVISSAIRMLMWSADVRVELDPSSEVAIGVQKATKKGVPKKCRYSLVYTEGDETVEGEDSKEHCVFQRLKSNLNGVKAHIYIGHATLQTTGIPGHVAARFIPTVERELIDFENKDVKQWNESLLYIGGYLTRTIYEHELQAVDRDPNQKLRALHALQFFSFNESSPAKCVSAKTQEAFFGCSSSYLPILSSAGVLPACDVRLYDANCVSFVKKVPILMLEASQAADGMLEALRTQGLRLFCFSDLINELSDGRVLSEEETLACFNWILKAKGLSEVELKYFLATVRFSSVRPDPATALSSVHKVLMVDVYSQIPTFSPFPSDTLPYSITKKISASSLEELMRLFSWKKLSIIDWLDNLVSLLEVPEPITVLQFTEIVFSVLASSNPTLPERGQILSRLEVIACIPTQHGFKRPKDVYMHDATAASFIDVPTVKVEQVHPLSESLLVELGVRLRVDLVSLLRVAEESEEALRYFLDHYEDYKNAQEMDRNSGNIIGGLKLIPVENTGGETTKVCCSEAFLNPGAAVLGFWVVKNQFLADATKLGLSYDPSPSELLRALIARPPSEASAVSCFEYLLSRSATHAFSTLQIEELASIPFIPTLGGMVAPRDCYVGQPSSPIQAKLFTFVDFGNHANSFLWECKAKREPTVDDVANALVANPHKFLLYAGSKVEYLVQLRKLADNVATLSDGTLEKLKAAPILLGSPPEVFGIPEWNHNNYNSESNYSSELLHTSEVVVVDDSKSYSFFRKVERLVHAPKSVEHFYLTLGCQTISSIVEEHYGSVGDGKAIAGHPRCTTTREYVLDRLRIFIADSHNSNWDKLYQDYCAGHNFQVQVFEKMRVLRVLKFRGKEERHTCDTTSGYSLDEKNRFILSVITGELDYYDVANCVSKIFDPKGRTSAAASLTTIYNSKLHVLKQRGYNVDVLGAKKLQRQLSLDPLPTNDVQKKLQLKPKPWAMHKQADAFSWNDFSSLLRRPKVVPKEIPSKGREELALESQERRIQAMTKKKALVKSRFSNFIKMRDEIASEVCPSAGYSGKVEYFMGVDFETEGEHQMEVWISEKPSDSVRIMAHSMRDMSGKFIAHILLPLQAVIGFDPKSIRLLCDPNCQQLNALNRDGIIYLNMEQIHGKHWDEDEEEIKDIPQTLIFWYLTLCHELAHNAEPAHNHRFLSCYDDIHEGRLISLFALEPLKEVVVKLAYERSP